MSRAPVDPWFKFFPRDWLDKTRKLSLEERGAYIDMIAMRMINDGPVPEDYSWLGHQMHVSPRKARAIVEGLIDALKIRRDGEGLTNDRCEEELRARDHQRKINTETAVKRERGRRENCANEPDKQDENREITNKNNETVEISCPEHSTTRARVDSETEEEKKEYMPTEEVGVDAQEDEPKPRAVRNYTEQFEEFWSAFPVKDGKWAAFDRSWRKLRSEDRAPAIEGAKLYGERVRRERIEKPKWAQGWLTERRWEDELRRSAPKQPEERRRYWWEDADKLASIDDAGWDRLIDKHANGAWPIDKLGFWPRDDRCVVPKSVIMRRKLWDLYDDNGIARGKLVNA